MHAAPLGLGPTAWREESDRVAVAGHDHDHVDVHVDDCLGDPQPLGSRAGRDVCCRRLGSWTWSWT